MATLVSRATGNLTAAGTWSTIDTTSFLNTETANTALTLSAQASNTFIPAASAIDAIGIKLAVRAASPSGTITVELFNSTGAAVAATVTVNVADLPLAAVADLQGGWVFFKLGATHTPNGTDSYSVRAFTSVASQVNLFSSATTNWARILRLTSTAAPGAGDDMIVAGELTGAGTGNSFVVTMDQTAATDYGSNTTSAVTPALAVCNRGSLIWGVAAATNYVLQLSGYAIIYGGGTYNQGAIGAEAPRTSTQVLQFDCAADGDFGLIARNESVCTIVGLSRSSGKDVSWCLLNADASVNATSLTVDTDTGWLDNDIIVVASTIRPGANQNEKGALNGNAGASSLTVDGFGGVAGGIAFSHLGGSSTNSTQDLTMPDGSIVTLKMQAEIINLTRNVVVKSVTTATLMTFVFAAPTAQFTARWVEFTGLGANSSGKRGVECDTNSSGSLDVRFCSFHDSEFGGLWIAPSTTDVYGAQIRDNVFYKFSTSSSGRGITVATARTGGGASYVIDRNVFIDNGQFNIFMADISGTVSNNRISGSNFQNGFNVNSFSQVMDADKFSGNVIHSAGTSGGYAFSYNSGGWGMVNLKGWRIWRCASSQAEIGFVNGSLPGVAYLEDVCMWGNGTHFLSQNAINLKMKNCVFAADNVVSTSVPFWFDGGGGNNVQADNVYTSPSAALGGFLRPGPNDFNLGTGSLAQNIAIRFIARNSIFGSTQQIATSANLTQLTADSYISVERLGGVAGSHQTWVRGGEITRDTSIYRTSPASMRMTPKSASLKCEIPILRGFKIPVSNGISKTVSIWTRKSVIGDGAAYNGNQPRLIVRANPALGLSTDTVLATASGAAGSWENLSGALPSPTDTGVFEVYVDCDGTAGWINVSDLSAA